MLLLAATHVSSLRSDKLLVYSYKGDARVSVSRSVFWLFAGHQDLMMPASATYYVEMADLAPDAVRFNPATNVVSVQLPAAEAGRMWPCGECLTLS